MLKKKEDEEKSLKRIILTIICLIFVGCSARADFKKEEHNNQLQEKEVIKQVDKSDAEEDKSSEETLEAGTELNKRPVIIHKYDVIILAEGLGGIMDFSENVLEVTDPEDGVLPYNNIGGFVGQQPDDFWYNLTHNDNPEAVATYGSGFYFSMGNSDLATPDGVHPITTFAYDSLGQLTTKEYSIKYIPKSDSALDVVITVVVEGLNVRTEPSTSASIIGVTWQNCGYQVFDEIESDGYKWYRIGDGMWIADNGEWVTRN